MKIGLIHEGKIPPDYRVALTPSVAKRCKEKYSTIDIIAQHSQTRCYKDDEYVQAGIEIVEDVRNCDVLLGIKEVPIQNLIENKIYFFFSHTIKKQVYNRNLLKAILEKKITLIDYETLIDENGKRLIGFGHFAGLVGAHNALLTYGKKTNSFTLTAAHRHFDYAEMVESYKSIQFPAIKIAITGGGNVTKGVIEIMKQAGIREISCDEFTTYSGDEAVFAVFGMETLYRNDKGVFDKKEFYSTPEKYKNNFLPITEVADILINGIFWKKSIPKLFEIEDIEKENWKIKVIADITCDPYGSVPINIGASTIADPVYGIHKISKEKVAPFQNTNEIIDIMAIDNLPNELGRDASQFFAERFEQYILPELLKEKSDILQRATITHDGLLTQRYSYLQDFVNEN